MTNSGLCYIIGLLNGENTIGVNRVLTFAIGMQETAMYQSLISKYEYYLSNDMLGNDGWFYSTAIDLQESTGFSTKVQKRLADRLIELGLIEKKLAGMPRKTFYRIVLDADVIGKYISEGKKILAEIHKTKERNAKKYREFSEKLEQQKQQKEDSNFKQSNEYINVNNDEILLENISEKAIGENEQISLGDFIQNDRVSPVSTNGTNRGNNENIIHNHQNTSSQFIENDENPPVSTNGRNKHRPMGETSIDQRANKTKDNKQELLNNTSFIHISSSNNKQEDNLNERMNDVEFEIKEIIEYDYLIENKLVDQFMLDVIVSYMIEIMLSNDTYVTYGKNQYNVCEFQKRIKSYDEDLIQELCQCYKEAENVKAPKNYLMKMIYEKPTEFNAKMYSTLPTF